MSGGDDRLSRWSRLKAEARARAETAEPEPAPAPEAPAPAAEERTDEEMLSDLGLPDPDTLQAGDDFKAFMAREVPARLRNRALRRLWLTNPTLANLDALVDYGEDFTDAATVVEKLETVYRVGRGMVEKLEAKAEPGAAGEAAEEPAPETAEEAPAPEPEPEAETKIAAAEAPAEEADEPVPDAPPQAQTRPRPRMRFTFDES